MYAFIRGKIVHIDPTNITLDCNGIGYEMQTSITTSSQLEVNQKQDVKLYTYLLVKEDSHTIYGFKTSLEKEVFKLLLSVSGVGGNTARSILSSLSPSLVRQYIINEDVYQIKSCKGIGLKTAQKICIELKDKMVALPDDTSAISISSSPLKDEVIKALSVLGYPKRSTERIVDSIINAHNDLQASDIIKLALNKL